MSISVFDHPWLGGLFGDAEMTKIWSPERQLAHMLAFEQAYTRALGETGTVEPEVAEAALSALHNFVPDLDDLRRGTQSDGLPVPALKRQMQAAAGSAAEAVHEGTTSQDVMDTALSLTLKETADLLAERLTALDDALAKLERRDGANRLMGRTRMQAALPVTASVRVGAWRRPLARLRERTEEARTEVALLQLGGPVGDRDRFGAHAAAIAAAVARELGLTDPGYAWHATRGGVADFAALLSAISGALGKMGKDVCLMAQQGVDEIDLAGGGGSSAMPHKQNPVLAELLVTLAAVNATQLSAMHLALVHEQERSGSAWTLEWMVLPGMALTTGRSLTAARALAERIERIGTPDAYAPITRKSLP